MKHLMGKTTPPSLLYVHYFVACLVVGTCSKTCLCQLVLTHSAERQGDNHGCLLPPLPHKKSVSPLFVVFHLLACSSVCIFCWRFIMYGGTLSLFHSFFAAKPPFENHSMVKRTFQSCTYLFYVVY